MPGSNYAGLLSDLYLPCDLDIVPHVFLHGDIRGDGIQIVTLGIVHSDTHLSAVNGQAKGCLNRKKSCQLLSFSSNHHVKEFDGMDCP